MRLLIVSTVVFSEFVVYMDVLFENDDGWDELRVFVLQ